MKWNCKVLTASLVGVMLLVSLGLAGCSSPGANPSSSAQPSTAQQPQSGRQTPGSRNGQNSQIMINKVAEILHVSADDLGNAYRDALSSAFPARQPSDGQRPQQGQQPQDGQGQRRSPPDMTPVYQKVATALNLSVADVSKAFDQARQSLQSQTQ
jgi:hypothetical protein